MVALIYVIEWQKRGPAHAHILGICNGESKPHTPDDFDKIVCAEIPDKEAFPELPQFVTRFMMHGTCGLSNSDPPCMEDRKCTKKFPKEFAEKTCTDDGYPYYKRRDDGKYIIKNGVPLDNKYVVPYNPYLSKTYNVHINTEICSSIKSCKYLYKYKGPDMALVAMQYQNGSDPEQKEAQVDEKNKYVNSRYVSAYEDTPQEALATPKDTTLLAWFNLNQSDPNARNFKYHEIPEHYVWNERQHKWTPRKQHNSIGQMYTTNPSQGERHYLHMLLHHIPGATCYTDLKTSPDRVIHTNFKETALAFGLLESDEEWDECLSEAEVSFMPQQLCSLFVTILIFGDVWDQ